MRGSLSDYDTLASALSALEMTEDDAPEWDARFRDLYNAALACGYRAHPGQTVREWSRIRVATYHTMIRRAA